MDQPCTATLIYRTFFGGQFPFPNQVFGNLNRDFIPVLQLPFDPIGEFLM